MKGHVHRFEVIDSVGHAFGRAVTARLVERCSCGEERAIYKDTPEVAKRLVREAKYQGKREALMLARAEIQARKGKTAKQRREARELLGEP